MRFLREIDFILVIPIILLLLIGLITNYPIDGFSTDSLFFKQSIFVFFAIIIMLSSPYIPFHIIRGRAVSFSLYVCSVLVLILLLLFAPTINGATSWFVIGPLAIQPVDFIKIVLCIVLAQYFSSRHVYIRNIRHLIISLFFTFVLFLLVFFQPDFGSSLILITIWIGTIFVAEISKKHILMLAVLSVVASAIAWSLFTPVQQDRIRSFLHPLENLQSTGYNAYQSKIAVGSGMILGKGIGEGTQSKLGFLPLYESDFVFAAFAEEWGFVGVCILFLLFLIIFWRLVLHALRSKTNFDTLFIVGFTTMLFTHMFFHIGVNSGIFPVTGITLPFMSYGGSHLIAESIGIAMVLYMARYRNYVRASELRKHRQYVAK